MRMLINFIYQVVNVRRLAFLTMVATLGVAVIVKLHPQFVIDVKIILFSKYTSDIKEYEQFVAPSVYSPNFIEDPHLSRVEAAVNPPSSEDALDIVRQVLSSFTFQARPPLICGQASSIENLLDNTKNGYGCCSDFSMALIARLTTKNVQVREVHSRFHTVNEFYDVKLGKWIFVDSMLGLMAKDESGHYISFIEMAQRFRDGQTVELERIFPNRYIDYRTIFSFRRYYSRDAFDFLMITMGNNVYTEMELYQSWRYAPKAVIQLVSYIAGKYPGYTIYSERNNYAAVMNFLHYAVWSVLLSYLVLWVIALGKIARSFLPYGNFQIIKPWRDPA